MFSLQMPVQKFRDLPPKNIFGAKNTIKLARFRTPSHLSSNISGTDRDIQKRKAKLSTASPHALDGKSPVNFGPLSTAFSRLMFTHQIDFFGKPYFSLWRVLRPKFLHAPQDGQVLLANTPKGMGVPPTIFFSMGVKIGLKCNV